MTTFSLFLRNTVKFVPPRKRDLYWVIVVLVLVPHGSEELLDDCNYYTNFKLHGSDECRVI